MHPAKRRRLDESNSTLSKPFRSPLKVDVKSRIRHINCNEQNAQPANVTDNEVSAPQPSPTERTTTTYQPSPVNSCSPVRKPATLLTSSPRAPPKDPQYLFLQKQHSALILQLSKLRHSLDTAQQALKIQTSNTDSELEILILKWKLVSREAAEELFRSAKDRVNRMGGVGAWRERNEKRLHGWDDEGEEPINEDDLSDEQKALMEEQKTLIEEQKEAMEAERQKYFPPKTEPVVERDDEVSHCSWSSFFCSRLIPTADNSLSPWI